jgi:SAM-dependent methyltransferase
MDSRERSHPSSFFSQYYDKAGVIGQTLSVADEYEREVVLGQYQAGENINRNLTALDVGCGYGRYARHLLELGYFYIGADPVKDNIDRLASELTSIGYERGKDFELHIGPLEQLALGPLQHRCDVAFSINVIHHTTDADKYLKSLRDCVRVNGAMVIIEPNPVNPLHWLSYALQRTISEEWRFLVFNPIYLMGKLKKLGIVRFRSLGPGPLRLINHSRLAARLYRLWYLHFWSPFDPFFRYEVRVNAH